jgi:cyclopropane fatty-acyl-phospholipid synthase-like methyltransferase
MGANVGQMWDDRYRTNSYVFGTEPAAFLRRRVKLLKPGMRALCIADGEGRNSVYLGQQGLEVTAMDSSAVGLVKAKVLARERGVEVNFVHADLLSWNWEPEAYDIVVGIFFQFVPPAYQQHVFDGIKQTLVPGGYALIHGYTPRQIHYATGGPSDPDQLYTEPMLRSAFADMTIERLAKYDAELEEGTAHVGKSALIDLIAQKPLAS